MRRLLVAALVVGCHRDLTVNPCSHDPAACEETGADTSSSSGDTAVGLDTFEEADTSVPIEDSAFAETADSTSAETTDGGTDAPVDSTPPDTCVCTPGETVAVAGACTGALEKKTKTCTAGCVWGAESCGLPKGWTAIADAPIPGRVQASAVWTGGEWIVYGGGKYLDGEPGRSDGAIYTLLKNTWTTLPVPSVPTAARKRHAAVWTGTTMIVWGGMDNTTMRGDGIEYDAFARTWDTVAAAPLSGRERVAAVWIPTIKKMFIWGGDDNVTTLSNGALYEPSTRTWSSLPAAPISARMEPAVWWTGTEVLLWGGLTTLTPGAGANDGALYNPATNTWRAIAAAPIKGRLLAASGLEGDTFAVFGGTDLKDYFSDGAKLAIGTLGWSKLPDAPTTLAGRMFGHGWVGGGALYAWSGAVDKAGELTFLGDGASIGLGGAAWTAMPTAGAPVPRISAAAVWTGTAALVWSGIGKPGGGIAETLVSGAAFVP